LVAPQQINQLNLIAMLGLPIGRLIGAMPRELSVARRWAGHAIHLIAWRDWLRHGPSPNLHGVVTTSNWVARALQILHTIVMRICRVGRKSGRLEKRSSVVREQVPLASLMIAKKA